MAGDWIKMRASLLTNPKVNGIARALEKNPRVTRAILADGNEAPERYVTRYVMRSVTIASLLTLWTAANEHTHNGQFHNCDLTDVDDIVGLPGFGDALVTVGWAHYDTDNNSVTLPNFEEYNTAGKRRTAGSSADRQRRYRERQKAKKQAESGTVQAGAPAPESDVTDNVTSDVTNHAREEKSREEKEKNINNPPKPPGSNAGERNGQSESTAAIDEAFEQFWSAGMRKIGKKDARSAFKSKCKGRDPWEFAQVLTQDIKRRLGMGQMGFDALHPKTYLHGERWNDEYLARPAQSPNTPTNPRQANREQVRQSLQDIHDTSWATSPGQAPSTAGAVYDHTDF